MKTLAQLQKSIITKEVFNYSVWAGEEYEIMKIYKDKILECGFKEIKCESVAQALQANQIKSLVKENKCYIVNDDADYLKNEKAWEKVKKSFKKSNNVIIIKYNDLDKRSKLYKQEEELILFDKLDSSLLINYVKKDLPEVKDEYLEKLIDICENSYGHILKEIDKVKVYSKAKKCTLEKALLDLLEDGTIYEPLKDVTFQFTDWVVYGDLEKSGKLLQQVKELEISEMLILSTLYNQFRNMLLVQGLGNNAQGIAARTGLTGWQVKQAKEKIGGYKIEDLIRNMKILREIEQGIKKGLIDAEVAIEYATVSCLW